MSAQPEYSAASPFVPPMSTFRELREALSSWGFPGDRELFEQELDGIGLDDLPRVREITQAYRHRVLLRCSPQGFEALVRSSDDVEAELRRKLAEAGAAR